MKLVIVLKPFRQNRFYVVLLTVVFAEEEAKWMVVVGGEGAMI